MEELCLYKENGETSVPFSNGPRHGSWRLTRRVPWRRNSTTVLDVWYQRGQFDPRLVGTLRERRFELVSGTSTFVKNLAGSSSETRTAEEQDTEEPTPSGNSGFEMAESAMMLIDDR